MGKLMADLAQGATAGVFSGIGSLFKDIRTALGKIDPNKAAEIELKLSEAENQILAAQAAINLEEAKSDKWWKAGWRPAVGWLCVAGLGLQYLVFPLAALFGIAIPAYSFAELINLLLALLGIGFMRTYEKKSGVA